MSNERESLNPNPPLIRMSDLTLHYCGCPECPIICPRCQEHMSAGFPGKTFAEFARMLHPRTFWQCDNCLLWADGDGACWMEFDDAEHAGLVAAEEPHDCLDELEAI